jgi:hypothetical protein
MHMIGFCLELAYALEAMAKRANQHANEAYRQALAGGYRFDGGWVVADEDAAWNECQRTGKWCNAWDDAICTLEDAWFVANGKYEG